jgi:hypothetical protein
LDKQVKKFFERDEDVDKILEAMKETAEASQSSNV